MKKILIFGNSASGKTTLAKQLVAQYQLAHLDLDTIAWQATTAPQRVSLAESKIMINAFCDANDAWVIEGCYSDLLELVSDRASKIIFINLPVEQCVKNAKNRLWEPHKYSSKQAQDKNLSMLVNWIAAYDSREDTFSKQAHQSLFDQFEGEKTMLQIDSDTIFFD